MPLRVDPYPRWALGPVPGPLAKRMKLLASADLDDNVMYLGRDHILHYDLGWVVEAIAR